MKVVVHHKSWAYLFDWLGIQEVAALEPKPSVPPSASHLAELVSTLSNQPARMVIRTAYEESRPSEWLSEHAHIPAVNLPCTVGGTPAAKDLFGLYDDTIATLLKAAQ
jgi:zinc/manganese transport system substrate-binding protein